MGSVDDLAARERPILLPADQQTEWDLIIRARHNVLVVGTPAATRDLLVAMTPHAREPLHEFVPTADASVPQLLEGTLVLLEIERLDAQQQAQLLQWLDEFNERAAVQVVSMTSEPLFPLVQTGAFLADLYYKLNVVLIDLDECKRKP